jgi:hypothetical protein
MHEKTQSVFWESPIFLEKKDGLGQWVDKKKKKEEVCAIIRTHSFFCHLPPPYSILEYYLNQSKIKAF